MSSRNIFQKGLYTYNTEYIVYGIENAASRIIGDKNMGFYDKMILSGFGNENANGIYYYTSDYNGYPAYQNGNFYLYYFPAWMPWSTLASYYIIEKKQAQGSIPVFKPLYRVAGTDPEATEWVNLQDITSGETTIGTIVFNEESSSSSIDSSSSSSSTSSSSSSTSNSSSSSTSNSSSSSSTSQSSSSSSTSNSSSSSTSNSSSSSSSSTSESSSSSSSTSESSSSSSSSEGDSSSSSSTSNSSSSSSSTSESSLSSSSSSSSEGDSSSSSSSSGVLGCKDTYAASTFAASDRNGIYRYTGSDLNSKGIYSNDTWYIWYDSAYGYWVMSNNAGDPPNQWISSKDTSSGCPDGTWVNENGTIS